MWAQTWPFLVLALIILCSIGGGGWIVWVLCRDSLDPKRIKRANRGRRSSD